MEEYITALKFCLLLYGDPRGRGAYGVPIILFITWRIGLISRSLGRVLDAELADEIFDAVLFTLEPSKLTRFLSTYNIFTERQFLSEEIPQLDEDKIKQHVSMMYISNSEEDIGDEYRVSKCMDLPFSHWSVHRHFIKKIDKSKGASSLLLKSLTSNDKLFDWLLENLPIASKAQTPWRVVEHHNIYRNTSILYQNLSDHFSKLQKTSTLAEKNYESANPFSKIMSRDRFAMSCICVEGLAYSWGSNSMGQLGSIASGEEPSPLISSRPFLIYTPRLLLPLKNILVKEVACGYSHTIALTECGNLFAWGSNRSLQLGIGSGFPDIVPLPTPIILCEKIKMISCGSEHSVALAESNNLYSWGQGEGGLLGLDHFNSQSTPQLVVKLQDKFIISVTCGGLHTLALTNKGQIWSWGRGEGGQLGIPKDNLICTREGELYQNIPCLIETFTKTRIIQIAAGDAHSLALELGGTAYAWGFSTSGQLGTGAFSPDHSLASPDIQQFTPAVVKLAADKPISHIFAGKTFSFFKNCNNEIFGCGSNHYSQLGLPSKVTDKKGLKLDQFEIPLPKKVPAFDFCLVNSIASGPNHCLANCSMSSRSVTMAWGSQRHAQLGLPTCSSSHTLPQILHQFNDVPVASISCGGYHSSLVIGRDLEDEVAITQGSTLKKAILNLGRFWNDLGD